MKKVSKNLICTIEGCNRPGFARTWCSMHWRRWRTNGDPNIVGHVRTFADLYGQETCTIEGCDKPGASYGWCVMHHTRWYRTGDPLLARPVPKKNPEDLKKYFCQYCGDQVSAGRKYCSEECRAILGPPEPTKTARDSQRPPEGLAAIYYIHESGSDEVVYIGYTASKHKTWGAILSDKKTAVRPNPALVSWFSTAIDPVLTPVAFVPKELARDLHRSAVRTAQEANWPILNCEKFLTTSEEAEENQREAKELCRIKREMLKRDAFVEPVYRKQVWLAFGGACTYCFCALPKKGWHLDHVIALANGGLHCYANVVPACPECNSYKRDLDPFEFLQLKGLSVL